MLGLGRPDDFRGDPYGWLTNQMSHVLVGIVGAWLLMHSGLPGWAALAAAALAAGTIETVHLRRGGRLVDSLTDVLFVVSGAGWHLHPSVPLFLLIVVGLVLGVRSRLAERRTDPQTGGR